MKPALFGAVLLMLAFLALRRSPNAPSVPQEVRELSAQIQGKQPNDIRAAIIERFGASPVLIGGSIERLDLRPGYLILNSSGGGIYQNPATRTKFWLLQTANPAARNILKSFEMMSLPDPSMNGSRIGLADLALRDDATYEFIPRGPHSHREVEAENFFFRHRKGTVDVRYVAPVTADTLLESLPERATIAQLFFESADDRHSAIFSLSSSQDMRELTFGSEKPLSFSMERRWNNWWR